MSVRADASTHATGGSRIVTMAEQALRGLSALIVRPAPIEERRAWELPVVCALILLGAVLRFWGLGSIGLHGDEETMAMPVMHILQDGSPRFPSGMFYGRAIVQLYLMAGSVALFGASEWALRVPSVICGMLLIFLAWPLGRRFLQPAWNMAFVATVAFLPGLIEVSQTARMYIFLHASIAAFAILVFRWERTGRTTDLALAVVMLLVGIQFHTLAIFSSLLLFFPGLARADMRKTLQGAIAFIVGFIGFVAIDKWAGHFYPPAVGFDAGTGSLVATRGGFEQALTWGVLPILVLAALGAVLATFVVRPVTQTRPRRIAGLLIFLCFLLAALLSWHLAVLMLLAGAIVARRSTAAVTPRLALVLACGVVIALVQAFLLHEAGIAPLRKVIGAMTGLPSIWTFLQLSTYSRVAAILAAAGCVAALWRLSTNRAVSDSWLFFALGAWVPLLLLGLFEWFVAVRYTDFALLPLLICAMFSLQGFFQGSAQARAPARVPLASAVGAAAAAVFVVNPVAFARTYDAGYADHPDHKGAAEFMRSVGIRPGDIVVAEDALQQAYYLGRVDYWLLGKNVALAFCENKNGEIRDFYTGAKLLGTGADLDALVARPDRRAIYVIGSGENQEDGRRFMRSFGIYEALQSNRFHVVYTGRDRLTKVWKVDEPDKLAHQSADLK